MHSSKLLKILRNLTEEEIRRFHKFIRSPYYSYKKHCLPFFEYIRRYYPDFTSSKLSKENAFYHLFPEKAFQSQKMRHVMTDLVNLLEDFLIAEQIKQNDFQRKKLLRDAYGDRDLYEYFEKSTEAITNTLEALPYRNSFYQHESMNNQEVYFFHPGTKKHLVKENYLESINEHLDQYFTLSKLQLATEMKARASILSKDYGKGNLASLSKYVYTSRDEIPEYNLYEASIRLYEDNSIESFSYLKGLFLKNMKLLSFKDQQYIFHHLLNFTIRKGNTGDEAFIKASFSLYKLALKEGLLINNDKMLDVNFTNICAAGIKLKEYQWVKLFINDYSYHLNTEMRENAKILCMAFLYYAQGSFKETDELISNFNFTSPFYQLRGKILSIRALLELFIKDHTYFDLIQSSSSAFEKFIRRNQTLGIQHKKAYLGFIQHLRQLVNLSVNLKLSAEAKEKFKAKISKQTSVINRDWLIQKIDEA